MNFNLSQQLNPEWLFCLLRPLQEGDVENLLNSPQNRNLACLTSGIWKLYPVSYKS
jgi:hypothetical protein